MLEVHFRNEEKPLMRNVFSILPCLFLLLSLHFSACRNGALQSDEKLNENQPGQYTTDSLQAVKIVQQFFEAFDAKDTAAISMLLTPQTIIVHHNGAMTNTAEMNDIIATTVNWWPRERKLSSFSFIHDHSLSVMSLMNVVKFHLPGNKAVEEPYLETWIFSKGKDGLKPVRIHYSKVSVVKHSEEV